jgi:hypothetical protein
MIPSADELVMDGQGRNRNRTQGRWLPVEDRDDAYWPFGARPIRNA